MDKKFYTIGEVSDITKVEQHTLRYWEKEFNLLRPARRESKQRRYIKSDMDTVEKIKRLVYDEKYTIEGAKKQLIKAKKQQSKLTIDKEGQMSFGFDGLAKYEKLFKDIKEEVESLKKLVSQDI